MLNWIIWPFGIFGLDRYIYSCLRNTTAEWSRKLVTESHIVVNRSWRSFGNPDFPWCESTTCRSWAFSYSFFFPRNKRWNWDLEAREKSRKKSFCFDSWIFSCWLFLCWVANLSERNNAVFKQRNSNKKKFSKVNSRENVFRDYFVLFYLRLKPVTCLRDDVWRTESYMQPIL